MMNEKVILPIDKNYYSISEVAIFLKKTVDDIIYFGAMGKVPIFAYFNGWWFQEGKYIEDNEIKIPNNIKITCE